MTTNRQGVVAALLVSALFLLSMYASKPAYAHNFGSDESASYLAKVQEIPVEAQLIQSDLGSATTLQWHIQRLTGYWTSYDTVQMAERNQLLSNEIPQTITNITAEAIKPSPNSSSVGELVNNLDGYMSESVSVRIDSPKLENVSVSALAIKSVLDEVLNDYGNATGASMSLTDMNNMGSMSMSSGNVSSMQMSIVNAGAYESAQGMTNAALKMWSDLKSRTPSTVSQTTISALDGGFAKLKQVIDGKQTAEQLMEVVHGTIHSNFIAAYNLQIQAMNVGGNGSGGMSMNGTAGASMSMLDKKRIAYVGETAMQRHSEHLMGAMATGSYKQNSNYLLTASGTGSPLSSGSMSAMSMSSGNANVQVKLNLTVYDSTPSETRMDIMGGTVTTGTSDTIAVQSGFAYYLPGYDKFIAVGFIPVKGSDGSIQSVQLLRLWASLSSNESKLPSSTSDSPLAIQGISTKSHLGSDWMLQMTGTIAYSGASSMTTGASLSQCGPVTVPISGGSQNASYYVSATYNGKCAIDGTSYSAQNPCIVVNGIGNSGHCEPITKGYTVSGNTAGSVVARDEWFHMKTGSTLDGTTLKPGEFLDIADTTPFFSTMGHIASVIPCDQYGDPKVLMYEGILDGGLNTLEPIQPQYLQHMSNPANGLCVYHFNFGATANNPDGVTDFALVNVSKDTVTFTDRNTLTFSLAEGYLDNAGGP